MSPPGWMGTDWADFMGTQGSKGVDSRCPILRANAKWVRLRWGQIAETRCGSRMRLSAIVMRCISLVPS
ncbi:hypothetical protein RAS2_06790 [Phycisphaerae bacterium RAS2]|nr:hypothetical protein RAS2_06790 [Phycisphaerae bacterium RAS2]